MQEVEQTSVAARVRRVRCLGIGMLMWKNGDGGKSWRVFKPPAVDYKPSLINEDGNNFTVH